MRRGVRAVVTALALAVSGLATTQAMADGAADAPKADPAAATTLPVRPTKPLTLAEEPSSGGAGWKLLFLAVAGGAGFYVWKKRNGALLSAAANGEQTLTIVKRAPIGVRTELLLVEVDGQRFLLGVTPTSIQTLATLVDDGAEAAAAAARKTTDAGEPAEELGDRFAAILDGASRRTSATQAAAPAKSEPPVEGQARGLLDLVARR